MQGAQHEAGIDRCRQENEAETQAGADAGPVTRAAGIEMSAAQGRQTREIQHDTLVERLQRGPQRPEADSDAHNEPDPEHAFDPPALGGEFGGGLRDGLLLLRMQTSQRGSAWRRRTADGG